MNKLAATQVLKTKNAQERRMKERKSSVEDDAAFCVRYRTQYGILTPRHEKVQCW